MKPPLSILKEVTEKLNITIISSKTLAGGQCNNIYLITTQSGMQYCIKHKKASQRFPELNTISIEGRLLTLLCNSQNIQQFVPQIILNDTNYYVYTYINAQPMKQSFPALSTVNRQQACTEIARFHYALSTIHKEQIQALGVNQYDPSKHKLDPIQHNLSSLTSVQQAQIQKAYEIYTNSLSDASPQLLHNDAHDQNIFIKDSHAIFIDFGDMTWRDIHYDFYRYVYDYPEYWISIVSKYEQFSGKKLNRKRIIAISLLRHLRSILEAKDTQKINSQLNYYRELLS